MKASRKKKCDKYHVSEIPTEGIHNHLIWYTVNGTQQVLSVSSVCKLLSALGLDKHASQLAMLAMLNEDRAIRKSAEPKKQ